MLILVALPSKCIKAQKTLEYNKVLLVGSTIETVPDGKVWKIESYLINGDMVNTGVTRIGWGTITWYARYIQVNGTNVWVEHVFMDSEYASSLKYAQPTSKLNGPIWLSEGTTLKASSGIYAISVVEFNEVP